MLDLTAEDMAKMCLGKVRHKTLAKAERNKERCEKKRPDTKLRIYLCPVCSWYHLTSDVDDENDP